MAIGKIKNYNEKEFRRLLIDNGFEFTRQNGDHFIYKRGNDVVVATKRPNKMMIRRMIKTYGLVFR